MAGTSASDEVVHKKKTVDLISAFGDKYKNVLEEVKKDNAKVLIVTDTILSGNGLKPLCDALSHYGVSYELASIGGVISDRYNIQKKLGARIYFGQGGTPNIYEEGSDKGRLSGVWKNTWDIHALSRWHGTWRDLEKPLLKVNMDPEEILAGATEIQESVNSARRDAFHLADELVKWYEPHVEKNKAT
ncbi:MAG: hypothetical protein Q7S66_05820 [bacterium]|nr:hypothetical protein [bacterium]